MTEPLVRSKVAALLGGLFACICLPWGYAITGFSAFSFVSGINMMLGVLIASGVVTLLAVAILGVFRRQGRLRLFELILALTLLAASAGSVNWNYPPKFIHVPQYFVLGLTFGFVFVRYFEMKALVLFGCAAILYAGLLDESIQGYLSSRTYGIGDIIVDWTAGLAGVFVILGFSGRAVGGGQDESAADGKLGLGLPSLTVLVPALASGVFAAFALGRFASVDMRPELWIFAPMIAGIGLASAVCALEWPGKDRTGRGHTGNGHNSAPVVLNAVFMIVVMGFGVLTHVAAASLPFNFH